MLVGDDGVTTPSIRAFLLLLAFGAAVLLMGATTYGIYHSMQEHIADTKASLGTLAGTMVRNTGGRIARERLILERLANRSLVKRVDARNCDPSLKDLLALSTDYANVTYVDARGALVCSAVPPPDGQPVDVGKAPWFQHFLRERNFVVGAPFFAPITGKWVSVLTAPIWNEQRELVGGVQIPLDLAAFDPNIETRFLPEGSRYGFLDETGLMVWRNVDPEAVIGSRRESPAGRRALLLREGEFEGIGTDGVARFFSVMPVPGTGWIAFLAVPVAAIHGPALRQAGSQAVVALLAVSLLFALALIAARRISQPILQLKQAAKDIEDGNLEKKVAVAGFAEVAQMGAAFNAMTDRLGAANRQRRETELVLRQSEERMSLILRGTNEGIWDWDLVADTLFYSERWWTMLGYADNELPTDTELWRRLLHPDDRQQVNDAFRAALISKVVSYEAEFRLRCKDGSYLPVASRGFIKRDESGQPVRVSGTNRDLSERKRAEVAMIKAKRLHEQAETLGNAGGWELDIDTDMLTWTDQTYRIYELDHSFQPTIHNVASFYPHQSLLLVQQALRSLAAGGASADLEFELTTAKGNRRYVRAIGNVDLANRKIYGFFQDITERKLKEVELQAAKADAEKANNAKSRFLAAASHDLRQPLSALSLYVGLLASKAGPAEAKLVGNIQECASNLNELLSDLLDISKLDAGVVLPRSSDFAVNELLANLVSIHAGEAAQKGLRLRHRRCGASVRGDRQLLQRIVGNFVANAIHYTDRGGVLVACRRRQGKCWIEVWDSGKGIPADQTAQIFEEFVQLGDDAARRGSGLGLAIATKTAGVLGLRIRVSSRPGRGSLFAIELPAETTALAPPPPLAAPLAGALRIAVIDNDERILDALAASLEHSGHRLIVATSVAALMTGLSGQAPDLLLSDYRLAAGATGFEAIAAIRQAFGAAVPAVLMTGDTDPALVRRFSDSGIPVHYKPLRMETLLAIIDETTRGGDA